VIVPKKFPNSAVAFYNSDAGTAIYFYTGGMRLVSPVTKSAPATHRGQTGEQEDAKCIWNMHLARWYIHILCISRAIQDRNTRFCILLNTHVLSNYDHLWIWCLPACTSS